MVVEVSIPHSNYLMMSVVICIASETVTLGLHILHLKELSVEQTR